jgi:hypothetical protein
MKGLISIERGSKDTVELRAKEAIADDVVFSEILQWVLSKNDEIRSKNYETLVYISKRYPKSLYLKWDFLASLLDGTNHFHRNIAINLLSNLTAVDTDNKFEQIFDRYFDNIRSDRTMVAGQAALNSGKIVKALPQLQSRITNILLNIERPHKGKQTELLKGYAIESFDMYFNESNDKKLILDFVKEQVTSNSPKTKKSAKEFLKKWEHAP